MTTSVAWSKRLKVALIGPARSPSWMSIESDSGRCRKTSSTSTNDRSPGADPSMSAIILSRPMDSVVWSIFDDDQTLPMPQSEEGRCVGAAMCEIVDHWMARPSCMLEIARKNDQLAYGCVPLRVVGKMRVKYRLSGRLAPRRYPVD